MLQWRTPGSPATGPLFRRREYDESPHREVRRQAAYWLARFLSRQANVARSAQTRPEPAGLDAEAERIFGHVAEVYGDVAIRDKDSRYQTVGAAARAYLRQHRELAVGRPAPEIDGEDLDGVRFKAERLSGQGRPAPLRQPLRVRGLQAMYPHERSLVKPFRGTVLPRLRDGIGGTQSVSMPKGLGYGGKMRLITIGIVIVDNVSTSPPTRGTGSGVAVGCNPADPNGTPSCQSALEIAAENAVANSQAASASDCVLLDAGCECYDLDAHRQAELSRLR